MANSADPDQKPTNLDLHCLQRQGVSGFSRTKVNGSSGSDQNPCTRTSLMKSHCGYIFMRRMKWSFENNALMKMLEAGGRISGGCSTCIGLCATYVGPWG